MEEKIDMFRQNAMDDVTVFVEDVLKWAEPDWSGEELPKGWAWTSLVKGGDQSDCFAHPG